MANNSKKYTGVNNILMRFNNKIFHISLSIVLFLVIYIYNKSSQNYKNNDEIIYPNNLEYKYIDEEINFSPNYQKLDNSCIDSTLEYNL